ncbi:MAG: hypothetical protein JNM17_26115 [Archangium sp.]|nr:hypothetical protein [Archangium sp.]
MTLRPGLAVLSLTLLSGCATILRNAEPDGFQRSLTELRQKHDLQSDPLIGAVPYDYDLMFSGDGKRSLLATGIPAPAKDEIEQRKLLGFAHGTEQEFCFTLYEKLEWNDYGNLRPEEKPKFIAARRKRMEAGEFYVEAFDSLVDLPARPVLPAAGAARLTVRDAKMGLDVTYSKRRVYDSNGNARTRTRRHEEPEMMYDLCGPAPVVSATTRYFTVSQKFKEATLFEKYTHVLYVFVREDEGDLSLDVRGTARGSRTTTALPSPSPSPSSENDTARTAAVAEAPKSAGQPRRSQLMSIERTTWGVGTNFTVTFSEPMKAEPGEKFWVTIVDPGAGSTAYTSYKYLDPSATTIELAAPAVSGDYEIRLHGNYPTKTYNLIDRLKFRSAQDPRAEVDDSQVAPEPADQGAKSKLMALLKARLNPNSTFTVKFGALKPKKSEKFWVAIATSGSPDSEYLSYQFVEAGSKSVELSTPDAPGQYEVRLHGNYPTKKTNVVDRVKLTVR